MLQHSCSGCDLAHAGARLRRETLWPEARDDLVAPPDHHGGDRPTPVAVVRARGGGFGGAGLSVEDFLRAEDFSPREEITPPTILDIVVSAEDSLYPPPDTGHFDERPETVFVYLSVEDLPTGEDVEALVERVESDLIFSFSGGELDLRLSTNRKIT